MTIFSRENRAMPPSENPSSIWLADARIKQMNAEHKRAKGDRSRQAEVRAKQDRMLDLRLWLRWVDQNGLR